MPNSSPHYLRQQHIRLFTSSERASAVEHLSHMDRLAKARFFVPLHGTTDNPEVDFRTTTAASANERITLAMATKLRRDVQHEEERIRHENDVLVRKLEVHASVEQRRKHHVNLVPVEEKKPFAEQASNIVARRNEARRIQADNETLMFAMATLKPTVNSENIRKSAERNAELAKRISKFKPAPPYAGAQLLLKPGTLQGAASSPAHSPRSAASREMEWQDVSPHDVVKFRKATDRAVRSVFLRDEEEVLAEAAAVPKQANVNARRLTWTQLGMQMAKVPRPPRAQ